ncbi:daunorubicin ABC transporter ATP-binding protein, partial [Bacillus anthracis]|nr:daunorubicin ABC transporter ATP-binding protein [Bacillus anthracis]
PDSHVVWWKTKEENAWIAKIPNEEVIISMLISKVVQAFQIKDLKINEVSTEEIIRNIYEEGIKHG